MSRNRWVKKIPDHRDIFTVQVLAHKPRVRKSKLNQITVQKFCPLDPLMKVGARLWEVVKSWQI